MPDDEVKPSEVNAQPNAGSSKPQSTEPGQAPKHSEVDAQPDKPMSDRREAQ